MIIIVNLGGERMRRRSKIILVGSFLVVILLGFGFVPETSSIQPSVIQIGVITTSTFQLDELKPLYKRIIETDINKYLAELPNNKYWNSIRVDFLLEDAQASSIIHLEKVQLFHEMGIDLIIGGGWSSMAAESLDYVNDNDILLFSPSSTSPELSFPRDNLFRLCPDANHDAKAIAAMISSRGIQDIIVIYRDDGWGNGLYAAFEAEYTSEGGAILSSFSYGWDEYDFTSHLVAAEDVATISEDAGVLLLGFDETVDLVDQAEPAVYPALNSLPWFGSISTAQNTLFLDDDVLAARACELGILSPLLTPTESLKYKEMAQRCEKLGFDSLSFYTATHIDIAWMITQAVLLTRTTSYPSVLVSDIIDVIPDIASRYFGYTGWCNLNDAGDRNICDYDIWGYDYDALNEPSIILCGLYNGATSTVHWQIGY
jgi:branched-chain amino acid transport system substrate-binding protein